MGYVPAFSSFPGDLAESRSLRITSLTFLWGKHEFSYSVGKWTQVHLDRPEWGGLKNVLLFYTRFWGFSSTFLSLPLWIAKSNLNKFGRERKRVCVYGSVRVYSDLSGLFKELQNCFLSLYYENWKGSW